MQEKKIVKRVLIMAGGTGGHVFPGLAIAHFLREKNIEVHWLGTEQGIESRLVPAEKIPFHIISVNALRGKSKKTLFFAPINLIKALWQSINIIKKIRPDIVIGMGGFVTGPGGIASWLLHIPLIIHEQNAKAGLTNQILMCFAKRVLTSFPNTFSSNNKKIITVGNPVRMDIAQFISPTERWHHKHHSFRLLVLGGSLGAQGLNTILPRALTKLKTEMHPEIIHQTGEKHFDETKKLYEQHGFSLTNIRIQPFIHKIAEAYQWADLVLCRAGALTIAELCAAGLGAILVPFPYAVDDHQTANAQFMVQHKAAICIQQTELTEDLLATILQDFSTSPQKCLAMANAAYQLRNVQVTEKIFDIMTEVMNSGEVN